MNVGLPVRGFAVFFAAIGAVEIVIGVHDSALAHATLGVTVTGVVLIAAGVVALVATHQLVELGRRRSWKDGQRRSCTQRVLVACLVTTFLGIYVFFSALRTAGGQRPVVVAVALLVIVVALAALRFFWRDEAASLPRVATTIALGVVGTLIGVSEFWYQNQYVPSHLESAVSLTVKLQLAGVEKDFDVIRATIDSEDIGGRNVSVIGSTYTLTGSRVIRCDRPATPKTVQGIFNGYLPDPQRSRFMANVWEEQPASVLAAGRFVGDGTRLDANVPASRQLLFFVPRGRYQLLRFRAQLFAISDSIPLSEQTQPKGTNLVYQNNLYVVWNVQDDSWLHDLIYGRERLVVTRYLLVGRPTATSASPDIVVAARFPDPTWSSATPSAATLEKLFAKPRSTAPTQPFADTELALEPIAAPVPGDYVPPGCQH